jgi:hypothetical protein
MAKACGMRIKKIGFTCKPLPHVYVSVIENNLSLLKRILFMISGNFTTIFFFMIGLLYFDVPRIIYFAFAFQIIIELNPFYSDYSLLLSYIKAHSKLKITFLQNKKYPTKEEINIMYKKENQEHLYSKEWYWHLFIWAMIIIILLSPKFIISLI